MGIEANIPLSGILPNIDMAKWAGERSQAALADSQAKSGALALHNQQDTQGAVDAYRAAAQAGDKNAAGKLAGFDAETAKHTEMLAGIDRLHSAADARGKQAIIDRNESLGKAALTIADAGPEGSAARVAEQKVQLDQLLKTGGLSKADHARLMSLAPTNEGLDRIIRMTRSVKDQLAIRDAAATDGQVTDAQEKEARLAEQSYMHAWASSATTPDQQAKVIKDAHTLYEQRIAQFTASNQNKNPILRERNAKAAAAAAADAKANPPPEPPPPPAPEQGFLGKVAGMAGDAASAVGTAAGNAAGAVKNYLSPPPTQLSTVPAAGGPPPGSTGALGAQTGAMPVPAGAPPPQQGALGAGTQPPITGPLSDRAPPVSGNAPAASAYTSAADAPTKARADPMPMSHVGAPTPKTKEEFAKLPFGAAFINPADGKPMFKNKRGP